MKAIIGLGNPEKEYTGTRHNIGKDVLNTLYRSVSWRNESGSQSLVAYTQVKGEEVVLVKPLSFMNTSGIPVKAALSLLEIKTEDMIVIYDDIDLPLGTVRLSRNRGTGGHRGIESLSLELDTSDFVRIRVGISPCDEEGVSHKPSKEYISNFVVGAFSSKEKEVLLSVEKKIERALELIVILPWEEANNAFGLLEK
ncbi:MAG: PTH1 family peptidyl-tRNA hydrolase [Flavobacteriaceae bacterium]|jgi:PTH1 family peptidyl-tRNA hydrolase